jgi:hypothetical protein
MQSSQEKAPAPAFRLDVELHQLLTKRTSNVVRLPPLGVPQKFPDPVFPQHPELLVPVAEGDWQPPDKRHWTPGQIYGAMRGWLFPYIRDEVRAGLITHPLDISDVWKNRYSTSTNHKVWAAKFTARHPNLVALEVSSFKCGHDAPIYGVIEGIIERSGTPYFSFKDLDENKPTGSIRIRVEMIDYFLRRYREDVVARHKKERLIEEQLATFERSLRGPRQSEDTYELAAAGD